MTDEILKRVFQKGPKKSLRVVDLFSGCGGISLGFKLAGFEIKGMVDFDEDSLLTAKKNNLSKNTLNIDLYKKDWMDELFDHVPPNEIDIVVGGPPCQGFSLTGPRNFDDKRNMLYKALFDLVKETKPKAFLIENVKGMATLYKGLIKKEIIDKFSDIGYSVNAKILNSKDFGVPQSRERLFYVGLQNGIFEFPEPLFNSSNFINCRDAIDDLPSLADLTEKNVYDKNENSLYQTLIKDGSIILTNHQPTRHTQEVINVISQVPEGGNYKDLPPGVGESRKFNEAWSRYHSLKPSKTIDTGHRNHFHYLYNRVPTVRENCRFQSFPDSFTVHGSKTSQNKQIGNAVPVLLAKVLAEKIYEQIECN